jgi:hypothetical protein
VHMKIQNIAQVMMWSAFYMLLAWDQGAQHDRY